MKLCIYLVARPCSVCFHDRMLAVILRLDFPVSGGLVEDDHHTRPLENSVFCYLVTVSVHVTFVDRRRHTFYPCAPLHVCHVWRSEWLAGPISARGVFPQMLEVVYDWRSLYARHTVAISERVCFLAEKLSEKESFFWKAQTVRKSHLCVRKSIFYAVFWPSQRLALLVWFKKEALSLLFQAIVYSFPSIWLLVFQ